MLCVLEAILMSTHNIQLLCRKSKQIPIGTIINRQWLEPPMSRTIFYGPKDVRAIEVRLYFKSKSVKINAYPIAFYKVLQWQPFRIST